jgi:hypothetical protein
MGSGGRDLKGASPATGAREQAMDILIANFGLYALAAFGAGFVLAWIACARANG